MLIADFENRVNDPLFDAALEQALSIAIERASFITSYRRDQALRVASQLNAGKTLDESTARLISRREGIKYVLSGFIEASGGGYKIALRAIDPVDGKTFSSAEATPRRKEEVLGAVAALASEIREALGDTKARGQRTADAETFTATSLDAMAAYARGQELNYAGRQTDALKAFQEAVTLDPGLARAYSGMGVIYGALKQDAKVEESYQNALQHLDRMTEREKFRTLGGYYLLVTHNYEKAIENYVALVDQYPADEYRPCQPRIRISECAERAESGRRRAQGDRNLPEKHLAADQLRDVLDVRRRFQDSAGGIQQGAGSEPVLRICAADGGEFTGGRR